MFSTMLQFLRTREISADSVLVVVVVVWGFGGSFFIYFFFNVCFNFVFQQITVFVGLRLWFPLYTSPNKWNLS